MQLTNFSFLNARNDFLESIAKRKVAADRIETGKRLEQTTKDLGAISQASKQKLEMTNDRVSINNLKNLRSFLYAQEVSLHRVYEMYDKIDQLAIKAANPITTEEERRDYQLEFEDYQKQLNNLMRSRYEGKLLFSTTEKCGDAPNIVLKELDISNRTYKNAGNGPIIRGQTEDIGSPSARVSFRVNSGPAGDTYRIWMGNVCVFSAGPAFTGNVNGPNNDLFRTNSDGTLTAKQWNWNADSTGFTGGGASASSIGSFEYTYTNADGEDVTIEVENGDNMPAFSGRGWENSNSAANGDDDLFVVEFGPGKETTYRVFPGGSNDTNGDGIHDWNTYTNGKYDIIETQNLTNSFDRTEMTLQIETNTIGVIYPEDGEASGGTTNDSLDNGVDLDGDGKINVNMEDRENFIDLPANNGVIVDVLPYIREVPIDSHGNKIYLDPKGFETLDDGSLLLPNLAQEVVDIMRGNTTACGCKTYFGEMKCLLENRLGILGSEYKRVDQEIAELEDQLVAGEAAYGRITGSDMAAEATEFAKQSIKTNMAVEVIGNSTRLKDVLIPLTTEHFRSSVLSAGI